MPTSKFPEVPKCNSGEQIPEWDKKLSANSQVSYRWVLKGFYEGILILA